MGFYLLFGLSVTASVQIVGVYLVFSTLIIPALATRRAVRYRTAKAYAVGAIGYLTGLVASMLTDLPTGALIVWTMAATGIAFAVAERGPQLVGGSGARGAFNVVACTDDYGTRSVPIRPSTSHVRSSCRRARRNLVRRQPVEQRVAHRTEGCTAGQRAPRRMFDRLHRAEHARQSLPPDHACDAVDRFGNAGSRSVATSTRSRRSAY